MQLATARAASSACLMAEFWSGMHQRKHSVGCRISVCGRNCARSRHIVNPYVRGFLIHHMLRSWTICAATWLLLLVNWPRLATRCLPLPQNTLRRKWKEVGRQNFCCHTAFWNCKRNMDVLEVMPKFLFGRQCTASPGRSWGLRVLSGMGGQVILFSHLSRLYLAACVLN